MGPLVVEPDLPTRIMAGDPVTSAVKPIKTGLRMIDDMALMRSVGTPVRSEEARGSPKQHDRGLLSLMEVLAVMATRGVRTRLRRQLEPAVPGPAGRLLISGGTSSQNNRADPAWPRLPQVGPFKQRFRPWRVSWRYLNVAIGMRVRCRQRIQAFALAAKSSAEGVYENVK